MAAITRAAFSLWNQRRDTQASICRNCVHFPSVSIPIDHGPTWTSMLLLLLLLLVMLLLKSRVVTEFILNLYGRDNNVKLDSNGKLIDQI